METENIDTNESYCEVENQQCNTKQILISNIVKLKRKYHLTPPENRYIDKRVREILNLATPKKPKDLPVYLTPAEIYHFLDIAKTMNPEWALMAEVFIFTGLRCNELRNVIVQDIYESNNQLLVRIAKGGKQRYVPLTNNLLHKIKLHLKDRSRGYLFESNKHQQYSKRMIQYIICKIAKQCNFDKQVHTHSLRHTFACMCLSKGLSLEQIKVLMGHSAIKTTEIYARLELGDIKQKYLEMMS